MTMHLVWSSAAVDAIGSASLTRQVVVDLAQAQRWIKEKFPQAYFGPWVKASDRPNALRKGVWRDLESNEIGASEVARILDQP